MIPDGRLASAATTYDRAVSLYEADHAGWAPASWDSVRPEFGNEPLEVKSLYMGRADEKHGGDTCA